MSASNHESACPPHFSYWWPTLVVLAAAFGTKLIGAVRVEDLLAISALPLAWRAYRGGAIHDRAIDDRARCASSRFSFPPERLFLLLTGWAAIATIVGLTTGTAGRGLWAALTMGRFLELIIVYVAAREMAPSFTSRAPGTAPSPAPSPAPVPTPGAAPLARIFTGTAVALAIFGVYEVTREMAWFGEPFARAFNSGWFDGASNHVAGFLVMAALTGGLSLAAALIGVMAAGSRTAFLALALVAPRQLWLSGRKKTTALFLTSIVIAALLAPAAFRDRALGILNSDVRYTGPHVERFTAWRVAVAEAPPWGVGLGARPSSVYESCYVWLYAETGLPGLLLYLAFLGSLLIPPRHDTMASPENNASSNSFLVRQALTEGAWRLRSGIAFALAILSLGANVLLIARIAFPAALLLGLTRPPDRYDESPHRRENSRAWT